MKFLTRNLVSSAAIALLAIASLTNSASGVTANQSSVALEKLAEVMPLSKAIGIVGQTAILKANSQLPASQVLQAAKDSTAWVDQTGMLFYVEPKHIEVQTDNVFVGTSSIPSSDAFKLNSRPGSQRVLYLDFDGHLVSGTAWNSGYGLNGADFYATPWDKDGNQSNWTNAELQEIIAIWQRVSEDYAPFDINITTQDPGEAAIVRSSIDDLNFGTRQVVTNGTNPVAAQCGCGGIAYVGVYNRTSGHASTNIAFTFNGGVKSASEAISHEAGHNLGLSHDGSSTVGYYAGTNGWAPIMGVGYYEPTSQWSKGEYPNANQLQDDLLVINSYGGTFASDDHGNTSAASTPIAAGVVDVKGLIGRPSDVDVFKITSGVGTVSLAINPATVSPNLDIAAKVLDEAGSVILDVNPLSVRTSSDVMSGLNATVTFNVPVAGVYYLLIDGVGRGDLVTGYSDYGSLGYYRITGSIPGAFTVPAPTITSLSPTSGPVGSSVSISGTNLTGATSVSFGSTSIPFTIVSESQINIVVPVGAVNSTISVTTAGGSATSSFFTVTLPAPTISSFTPTSGPVGTTVTVTGANFPGNLAGTTVTLGGALATATYVSSTQLRFVVPIGAGTTGNRVLISSGTGSATSAGTFTVGPRILSFGTVSNNSTTAAIGQTVRLTGDHFTGATSVRIGTLSVAFTRVSDTEITFVVPSTAKSGAISVTANGVSFTTSSNLTVSTSKGSTKLR